MLNEYDKTDSFSPELLIVIEEKSESELSSSYSRLTFDKLKAGSGKSIASVPSINVSPVLFGSR